MPNTTTEAITFHDVPALRLTHTDGSQATVTLDGAQVVSWTTADGVERMYLSPKSVFTPGQTIRGGVPVIFPQFNARGPGVRHGFARISRWKVLPQASQTHTLVLGLRGNGAAWSWPRDYACEMAFQLEPDRLSMQLTVHNPASTPFTFTAALHTYLNVEDIHTVALEGLHGCTYEDFNDGSAIKPDIDAVLAPRGALDRIYLQSPHTLQLRSALGTMRLLSAGFVDTVVWNPGQAGCAGMADMAPDSYQHFLCVEAALISQPMHLPGGDTWQGSQTLQVVPR